MRCVSHERAWTAGSARGMSHQTYGEGEGEGEGERVGSRCDINHNNNVAVYAIVCRRVASCTAALQQDGEASNKSRGALSRGQKEVDDAFPTE